LRENEKRLEIAFKDGALKNIFEKIPMLSRVGVSVRIPQPLN
jgi:hypothetical protein